MDKTVTWPAKDGAPSSKDDMRANGAGKYAGSATQRSESARRGGEASKKRFARLRQRAELERKRAARRARRAALSRRLGIPPGMPPAVYKRRLIICGQQIIMWRHQIIVWRHRLVVHGKKTDMEQQQIVIRGHRPAINGQKQADWKKRPVMWKQQANPPGLVDTGGGRRAGLQRRRPAASVQKVHSAHGTYKRRSAHHLI